MSSNAENVASNDKPGRAAPHRHSHHIYLLLAIGLLVLGGWGFARISLCWGRYGWLGAIACHSQWATFLMLLVAVAVMWLLVRDLAAPHEQQFASMRMTRARAAWHGYRHLERPAFLHVTAATLLLIFGLTGFAWLVLLSPVRF